MPTPAAPSVAGHRLRIDVCEATGHSTAHSHLADAGRSPHAAAMGNLSQVKHWFDESGAPALGDLGQHFPCKDPQHGSTTTSSGARRRRSTFSTRRSPGPSSIASSRWRTSFSVTAQTSTPIGTHMSRRASSTIWSFAQQLRVDAIPHRPRHRHDDQRLPLERYGTRLGAPRRE